jgi:hypothetical protein
MKIQPMTKKLQKSLERSSKMIAKSVGKDPSKGKKKVAAASIALVGAAGVATAVHLLRKKLVAGAAYHVRPGDEGWIVTNGDGNQPIESFETKKAAVEAGRKIAKASAPSELMIFGTDGSRTASHRYTPA